MAGVEVVHSEQPESRVSSHIVCPMLGQPCHVCLQSHWLCDRRLIRSGQPLDMILAHPQARAAFGQACMEL